GGNLQVKSGSGATIASKASPDSPDAVALPQRYALSQNWPNPFNPSTSIRFDLPEDSHVRLVVYDALGRQVVELVNGTRSAGMYQELWQGRDASGRAVPSGVYFAHIEAASVMGAGNLSSTRKMLLLQ
ncbi:MAG TPA: FlgD immunoglobulin-like domain containing protein, partial [Candidatus Krumholzibacteria bacterium]|nr:FlgD immunoglobulin-like domain containing protein [Candidatus Krumholzibacteria bacterium]